MSRSLFSRRGFLQATGVMAGGFLFPSVNGFGQQPTVDPKEAPSPSTSQPDYELTIAVKPIELAPNRIISVTTYNGQFPGPLLRFKEGQQVVIDIHNQTDRPEQLHWHGQFVSTDVDGAAEEGTPFHCSPRKPPHFVCSKALRLSLLPHPCTRESRPQRRSVQRPCRSRIHRAEEQSGQIRS